jgi:hypothetical protein
MKTIASLLFVAALFALLMLFSGCAGRQTFPNAASVDCPCPSQ